MEEFASHARLIGWETSRANSLNLPLLEHTILRRIGERGQS
jgi:hypothetical protein